MVSSLKKVFYFLGGIGSSGVLCQQSFSSDLSANYPYQSMVMYRETACDFLFERKGCKDLPCALLREKRFLAGNKEILLKINNLEEKYSKGMQTIDDNEILGLLKNIENHCTHEDENLEIQKISLSEKLLAVNDIVIIYQSFLGGQNCHNVDSTLPLVRFWQRFTHLFNEKMKKG